MKKNSTPFLLILLIPCIYGYTNNILSETTYMGTEGFYSTYLSVTNENPLREMCNLSVNSKAGYFTIDASTKKDYFYWFFESRSSPSKDPVVLWLTGGPGCSSELALLAENGPCLLSPGENKPHFNPYSWNSFSNLLYVDQPAGTGFSTANKDGYDSNEAEVSTDLYHFILEFLKSFPQFQNNDFYITGESYAGHYVPATSHRVWVGNNQKESEIHVNLRGLAVGNGLTAPEIQYKYYPQMAYNFTLERLGKSVISLDTYRTMEAEMPACISMISACQSNTSVCNEAQEFCNNIVLGPYQATGLNVYNVRLPCTVPGLCYDFSAIDTYLNLNSTKASLGVDASIKWENCNYEVNGMFSADWMKNFNNQIPDLLADNVRVLIYAGDLDFICNWIGNKEWTLQLEWPGKDMFNNVSDLPWHVNGVEKGRKRSYKNLSFLQVYEAGHMVPMDQGEAALHMLKQFLNHH